MKVHGPRSGHGGRYGRHHDLGHGRKTEGGVRGQGHFPGGIGVAKCLQRLHLLASPNPRRHPHHAPGGEIGHRGDRQSSGWRPPVGGGSSGRRPLPGNRRFLATEKVLESLRGPAQANSLPGGDGLPLILRFPGKDIPDEAVGQLLHERTGLLEPQHLPPDFPGRVDHEAPAFLPLGFQKPLEALPRRDHLFLGPLPLDPAGVVSGHGEVQLELRHFALVRRQSG
jgi:hypothetical protein